jgi:serine/threonine-protein kinase
MVGKTISHYKVLENIGQGGMGEVYLAEDSRLDRKVALKILPEHLSDRAELRERFEREARAVSSLNHPHICTLYDIGEQDGIHYLVMEHLVGETLEARLAKGPLPLEQTLEYAIQIADALEAAHKQNIVHRDLKPSNIMLTPGGHVKVMDFGLAKRVTPVEGKEEEVTTKLTKDNSFLGTVPYMSPEQLRGQEVDSRSDIFSFGVVLYEMLAGVHPFKKGGQIETANAILSETPAPLSRYTNDISGLLQYAVKKMLAKEQDRRYQLIHEVRTDLGDLIEESGDSIREVATGLSGASSAVGWQRWLPWALASIFAGSTLYTAFWSQPALPETPVRKFELLVPSPGSAQSPPQISPDGAKIVYFSEGQLWIRELDQWQLRALDGTQNAFFPCWSPDSTVVAYLTTDGRLMKVPISGGEPQVVAMVGTLGGTATCTWEPNGRILIAGTDFGLLAVSSQGGDPKEILPLNQGEADFHEVSYLPGGAVLFSTHDGSIEYFDGSTRKEILNLGNESLGWPIYSESGYLVYHRGTTNPGIWAVPFSLSRQEITGQHVLVVPGADYPSLSTEEPRTLAYVRTGGVGQQLTFVWVDREGREEPVPAEPRAYGEFSLSPDGTKIAVPVTGPGNRDVWIYDLVRDTPMRLTFDPGNEVFPIWTPDGQRVAFGSLGAPLSWKAADGTGEVETLVESSSNQFPQAFSPDGTTLIFEDRSSSGVDLGTLSLEGERISTLLMETKFTEQNLALSSDGRWMAYESNESGQFEVYVRPFPDVNGGRWQVSSGGGGWPLWSADGRELFYGSSEGMMAVPIETESAFTQGTVDLLFDLSPYLRPSARRNRRRIDISPEGDRFLMQKAGDGSDETAAATSIIVVLNWFEELKRLVPTDN